MQQILFSLLLFSTAWAHESISTRSISLRGQIIPYTVTVTPGKIGSIAYVKEGLNRPITFAFNGGPGSSSVWLHLGALGPRRILSPEEGQSRVPPYELVDNLETILDLTDLVFIDPMGTGLSKASSPEEENQCYSLWGDIESVGVFIRDYLTQNKRWNCPKYIAGESYGALRAAGLAYSLQNDFGIYLNGLILISPALDYQTFLFNSDNPLPYFLFFPTYVTTAWHHGKYRPEATLEQVAQEAREFVYQTYAPSLLCHACFDREPIYQKISEMTSLPLDFVRQRQGKIGDEDFFVNLSSEKRVGRADSRVTGHKGEFFNDPSGAQIEGIFSGAFQNYLQTELGYVDHYTIFSMQAYQSWDFKKDTFWGYPNILTNLRQALVSNPSLKIFVGCGFFDLATPFATAEYCLDHLSVPEISVQLEHYQGGHMYYLNPSSRVKFKNDLVHFYQGAPR